MKTLFIEAKSDIKFKLKQIDKLPKKIALATTVQFISQLKEIKKELEKNNKKVILLQGKHSKYKGQILGCDIINYKLDVDAYLYIGDGLFHPKAILLKTEKPVFAFNPFNKTLTKLDNKDIDKIKKQRKAALIKFHSSDKIGIIVSTKPGQNKLKKALELKLKNKQTYIFLTNTLDFSQLENFPFIQCWVNTACPRIAYDDYSKFNKPVINIDDL